MGKRSNFKRRPQDAYDTPLAAIIPLIPHLEDFYSFAEPCAGKSNLATGLERLHPTVCCCQEFDIEPRKGWIAKRDALTLTEGDLNGADYIITNPPWTREILHPMIEHFSDMRPTWLLFDADWVHTKQSVPFMNRCRKIVSVGRVSWMQNGTSGKDNCAWHLFDKPSDEPTEFHGRVA